MQATNQIEQEILKELKEIKELIVKYTTSNHKHIWEPIWREYGTQGGKQMTGHRCKFCGEETTAL